MRNFGLRASAIALLRSEFLIPETEIKESLLDLCVAAGGNKFDVALQYVIARARSIGPTSAAVHRVLVQDLYFAEQMTPFASDPSVMLERVRSVRTFRAGTRGKAVTN